MTIEDSDWRHGPVADPVERFGQLPDATRKWLEALREEDIVEIHNAIMFYRTASTVGKWNLKILLLLVALFTGTVALVAALKTARGWLQ